MIHSVYTRIYLKMHITFIYILRKRKKKLLISLQRPGKEVITIDAAVFARGSKLVPQNTS